MVKLKWIHCGASNKSDGKEGCNEGFGKGNRPLRVYAR